MGVYNWQHVRLGLCSCQILATVLLSHNLGAFGTQLDIPQTERTTRTFLPNFPPNKTLSFISLCAVYYFLPPLVLLCSKLVTGQKRSKRRQNVWKIISNSLDRFWGRSAALQPLENTKALNWWQTNTRAIKKIVENTPMGNGMDWGSFRAPCFFPPYPHHCSSLGSIRGPTSNWDFISTLTTFQQVVFESERARL